MTSVYIAGECIYDKGSWENCDPVTNKRAKVKSLKSGNPKKCKAEKKVYRSCVRANGQGMIYLVCFVTSLLLSK